jgi:hypothetical protein
MQPIQVRFLSGNTHQLFVHLPRRASPYKMLIASHKFAARPAQPAQVSIFALS